MRVCESPTMLKDGSGWGAHAGVTAALLAATASPARPRSRSSARRARLLGRPRHALAHSRAVLQGVPGVPLGAARDRGGACALQRAHRFAADDIASIAIESFREAIELGAACRAARDDRRGAVQPATIPWRPRSSSATSAPREVEPPRLADPRVERLTGDDADRGRRVLAPLSGRALGAGAHRRCATAARSCPRRRGARRSPRIRSPTTNCEPSSARSPSRCSASRARRESSTPCAHSRPTSTLDVRANCCDRSH